MADSNFNNGNENGNWRIKQKQVEWRRNKIQELLIKGHNQVQVSQFLKVSESTVSRDVENLREKARQNMQSHLQDRLPEEYENCMAGINQVLKMSWEIANRGQRDSINDNSDSDSDRTLSSTVDDRTRLQALALANDCYKYKMDLVTNGVVITDAIKFVQQKKEELNQVHLNSSKNISSEVEAKNGTKEKDGGEKALTSDKVDDNTKQNTRNKVF